MAPMQVKYKVETIIVFLPNRSANIDKRMRPVTLPTNYDDSIESLMYLSSQYKFM